MVQPKTPPLSIRLPPDLAAEIQKHADAQEVTRHAAIIALLRQALAGHTPTKQKLQELQTAQMLEAAKPITTKEAVSTLPSAPRKPKPKAEAAPAPRLSVSLPYAGNLVRKPTQKGGKK